MGNMMLITVFCQLIMPLGNSVLLGGFKIGYEFLDVSGVDAKS